VISATTSLILNNFFSVQCVVATRMPSTRRPRHSCHASSIHSLFYLFYVVDCRWNKKRTARLVCASNFKLHFGLSSISLL